MKSNFLLSKIFLTLLAILLTGAGFAQTMKAGNESFPGRNASSRTSYALKGSHSVIPDGYTNIYQKSGQNNPQSLSGNINSPAIEWNQYYGGATTDECYAVQQTSDGGYIMIGRSNSYGAGDFDAWLVKTDAEGTVEWTKTYGDYYIDEAYMVKELNEGGYIIAGMSTAFGNAGEGWLIKTDASGEIIWSNPYHPDNGNVPSAWDYLYDVVELSDGSLVAVGNTPDIDWNTQAWIMKVNSDGDKLWEHEYGLEYWERLWSVSTTSDGGFIACGDRHWTYDSLTWKHDGWLLKFDANGDTTWTRHFGDIDHDIFRSVKQTNDGGYIIAGEREPSVVEGFHGWVVRTDASGNELWNKTFDKGGLYGVQQCPDGNFLAAGIIVNAGTACDGWLLKLDQNGDQVWVNVLVGTDQDDMYLSLNKTSDGGYIMGGKYAANADGCDYWLVKMAPEGIVPLDYFFQNFDTITPPAFPENWKGIVDAMLTNTVAEVRTMEQGSTTSLPNDVFIMNGLDGSNGQKDTTVFAALITPYVRVGSTGAELSFYMYGGNSLQVGKMSDPNDPATFVLVEEVPFCYEFTKYTVTLTDPCTTYLALKNANNNSVTPIWVDDIEFKQIGTTGTPELSNGSFTIYPNPASNYINVEAEGTITGIRIINYLGATVYSDNAPRNNRFTLNTASLNSGNYVMQLFTANGKTLVNKFIITR